MSNIVPTEGVHKKARTPEARARQLQSLAVDLSESRLRDGTASSQEIIFWLKQASPERALELRNLALQGDLIQAKLDALKSEQQGNQAYLDAMDALRGYQPSRDEIIEGDYHEY